MKARFKNPVGDYNEPPYPVSEWMDVCNTGLGMTMLANGKWYDDDLLEYKRGE